MDLYDSIIKTFHTITSRCVVLMEIDAPKDEKQLPEIDQIINNLVNNHNIIFKSQQRGESDLDTTEKTQIASELYEKSKINFLLKFGKYLQMDELQYFETFITADNEPTDYENIRLLLNDLNKTIKNKEIEIKNRRFEALQQMVKEGLYFSETEMMKRDPLLYEQLIGQYLSEDEIQERDRYQNIENVTLVKILMEGIERNDAESSRKVQQEQEDHQMEEVDTDDDDDDDMEEATDKPSTSRWGEFESDSSKMKKPKRRMKSKYKNSQIITEAERFLLKDEFVTTMYQNFLHGKDGEHFDYSLVDNNASYDNTDEMDQDLEDKYFDSEDPEDEKNCDVKENGKMEETSSEDELDAYMKTLKPCRQHPDVSELVHNFNETL